MSYIHNRPQWYLFIKWCLTNTTGPSDISLLSNVLHTQQVPVIFIYQVMSYIHNRPQWYLFIKWCLTYTTGLSDISLSSDVLHTQQVPVIFLYQVMSYIHNRSQWYLFIKWCLTYTTGPSDISLSSDVLLTCTHDSSIILYTNLFQQCYITINPCAANLCVSMIYSFKIGIANAISRFKWRANIFINGE